MSMREALQMIAEADFRPPRRQPQPPLSAEEQTAKATRSIATCLWLCFAIFVVFPMTWALVAGGLAAFDVRTAHYSIPLDPRLKQLQREMDQHTVRSFNTFDCLATAKNNYAAVRACGEPVLQDAQRRLGR